jgi:hypothetical protein
MLVEHSKALRVTRRRITDNEIVERLVYTMHFRTEGLPPISNLTLPRRYK